MYKHNKKQKPSLLPIIPLILVGLYIGFYLGYKFIEWFYVRPL